MSLCIGMVALMMMVLHLSLIPPHKLLGIGAAYLMAGVCILAARQALVAASNARSARENDMRARALEEGRGVTTERETELPEP
jgi:hypothetical protein